VVAPRRGSVGVAASLAVALALSAAGCAPSPPPRPAAPAVDTSDAWFAYFGPGSHQLSAPDSFFSLGYVVALLDLEPQLQVLVIGHADAGRGEYTRTLSLKRARAVREVLMKHGVAASRILVGSPKDKSEPADPSLSRRADIYVYDPVAEEVSHRLGYAVDIRQE
jgi:outer membrane protein OmpA-like peptidoglycan-associated protein